MAFALFAEAKNINGIDDRLPRALVRVGFSAVIHAKRGYDESDKDLEQRKEENRTRIRTAIDRELAWLSGQEAEPTWPVFPLDELPRKRPRSTMRVPGGRRD